MALTDSRTIERLLAPSLEDMGFRLVRVSFGSGARPVLQIMAEPSDGGPMTVEHCADISRSVSALLDVADPIKQAYRLEVSSPGIDRPLVAPEDYRRFAGFEARIELSMPVEGRKRLKGRITAIDDEERITVTEPEGPAVAVPFTLIAKAKLVLTDDLIAASLARQAAPTAGDPQRRPADNPTSTL